MTITMQAPVEVALNQWRVNWSSDQTNPVFQVWFEGEIIYQGPGTTTVVDTTTEPHIEVTEDHGATAVLQETYPGRVLIQWFEVTGADYYLIEQNDGGWTTLAQVGESGRGNYQYETGFLADVTSHQFRVTPYDSAGNAGTAAVLSVLIVRNPSPPDVTYTYSSGTGLVTVAAA